MSFSLDIAKFAKRAKGNAALVVQKVVIDIGTRIVEKSPVGNPDMWESLQDTADAGSGPQAIGKRRAAPKGYVGGRFRANWQYGNNTGMGIPMQDLPDIDATGGKSISRITNGVAAAEPFGVHYLINNLPYAQRLENGWSKQAPQGMVALTVVEYQSIVKEAAASVYHGRATQNRSDL